MIEPGGIPFTTGEWSADERESVAALDQAIESCGLFNIYREVQGRYLQPRFDQVDRTPRIDRILSPRQTLIARGWTHGPIGVECKRSGINAGPALSQMLDYSRVAWEIRPGFRIVLSWVFLWPLEKQGGAIASLMEQNRLGGVWLDWGRLRFYSGEAKVLRCHVTYDDVEIGEARNGRRAGSR